MSQSFVKRPNNGPHSALSGLGVLDTEKMKRSAREHGMDLEDAPVAYEFYNPATGHAVVDYTRWTHVGHLREEDGYIARPLVYAASPAVVQASEPTRGHRELMLLAAADLESWMKSYNRDAATEDLVKRLREAAMPAAVLPDGEPTKGGA